MRFRFAFLVALVLSSVTAYADTITFALTNPTQSITTSGGTLSFNATVSAPATNTGREYLNGDAFNVASPLTLNDSAFFNNFPLYLVPGQSYSGMLFSVLVPSGTTAKNYAGIFSLLGGSTDSSSSTLGTQTFSITVTPAAVAVTPEPSSLLLLGTGMAGLATAFRRRFAGSR